MSYSYTLVPMAMPSFDMVLFIILSFLISCFLCLIVAFIFSESDVSDKVQKIIFGGITAIVTAVVFLNIFYNYKEKPIPKNEVVCGNRIDFNSSAVGKSKTLAGFVQYEMCDGSGIVTLRTESTKSYPEQLNFYKN